MTKALAAFPWHLGGLREPKLTTRAVGPESSDGSARESFGVLVSVSGSQAPTTTCRRGGSRHRTLHARSIEKHHPLASGEVLKAMSTGSRGAQASP